MKIFETINKLSNIRRWSHCYCNKPESVLEHTAVVSFISLEIGMKVNANMGLLLSRCILHDIEETITGDIPTPTKYHNKKIESALNEFEKKSAREVCSSIGEWAYPLWLTAKDNSLEGQILRIADLSAVLYKIEQERIIGNNLFLQYAPNCKRGFFKLLDSGVSHPDLVEIINKCIKDIDDNF